MNASNWRSVLGSTGSAFLNIIKMLCLRKKKNTQHETINEVLFYGAEDDKKKEEIGLDNLFCIYYVIVHACRSIDVCLPTLNSDTITKCLIAVRQRNCALIRVALYDSNDLEKLHNLADLGIAVRLINSVVKLEHEFVLVDANEIYQDAVAILGSLDYEISRINCNRDYTLLTSETTVILTLKKEFNRVWSTGENILKPKNYDES